MAGISDSCAAAVAEADKDVRGIIVTGGEKFFSAGADLNDAQALSSPAETVAAADFDFNRGVSREEFRKAAGQRFVLLDTKRDGRLEPAELVPFSPRGSAPAAAEAMKIDD